MSSALPALKADLFVISTAVEKVALNYGKPDKGHRANGFTTDGGFAEYAVNHINTLARVPDTMSDAEATLVVTAGTSMYGLTELGGLVVAETNRGSGLGKALLAAAEDEHRKAIEAMKKDVPPAKADSKVLEKAKNVFQKILERKHALTSLKGDPDGFKNAIRIAEEGIKLYEEMAGKETNPAAVKVLQMLAEEERKHLHIMENIYDFAEAPHTYLAWGEFGNLKDY